MQTYRITYDVDRGSMMNDAVTIEVMAKSVLRAVRLARPRVFTASDCIDRINLIGVEVVKPPKQKEQVLRVFSDLFGRGYD